MTKLLIVDDDADFAVQLAHVLEKQKYQCFVLTAPEQVIETIKKEKIPIILLDIMMPRVSGFELCRRIRIDRDVYNTGIIFMSAMKDREELEHGFSQGGDDYIVKPISMPLLSSRLNALIASQQNNTLIDSSTGIGTVRFIRLELQRAILLRQSFGLVYIELTRFPSLQNVISESDVLKIINIFVKHIKAIATGYFGKNYQLGHIGKGHFILMIPPKDLESFLKDLKQSWEKLLPEIYSSYQLTSENLKDKREPLLSQYLCGLHCSPTSTLSPQSVFDSLKHLHAQCRSQIINGILIDRRNIK